MWHIKYASQGKIKEFNSLYVPVYNEMSGKIRELDCPLEKVFLAGILELIVSKIVRFFFSPRRRSLLVDIEKFNRGDFEKLISILMIWSSIDVPQISQINEKLFVNQLYRVLSLGHKEFYDMVEKLQHNASKSLDILWEEVCNTLAKEGVDTDLLYRKENKLSFRITHSRISREGFMRIFTDTLSKG